MPLGSLSKSKRAIDLLSITNLELGNAPEPKRRSLPRSAKQPMLG
jgi:hypothetical protein